MIAGYMIDISNPESFNYTGTAVIPQRHHDLPRANAFYIGGNTPHVWTHEQVYSGSNEYRLPIWVYRNNTGEQDAKEAIAICVALGMPRGRLICLDMETNVDPDYSRAFHDEIVASGYMYVLYESESVSGNFIGANARWGAEWTGLIHINTDDWATQYADSKLLGHPFDISAVSDFSHLWNIKTDKVPSAPPPPVILQAVIVHPSLISEKVVSTDGKVWTTGKIM
jgi:hypothetical protein